MRIDREEHRKFLLELLQGATAPGPLWRLGVEVLEAIEHAEIGLCEKCQKDNK